jgi:hypothetical protein
VAASILPSTFLLHEGILRLGRAIHITQQTRGAVFVRAVVEVKARHLKGCAAVRRKVGFAESENRAFGRSGEEDFDLSFLGKKRLDIEKVKEERLVGIIHRNYELMRA